MTQDLFSDDEEVLNSCEDLDNEMVDLRDGLFTALHYYHGRYISSFTINSEAGKKTKKRLGGVAEKLVNAGHNLRALNQAIFNGDANLLVQDKLISGNDLLKYSTFFKRDWKHGKPEVLELKLEGSLAKYDPWRAETRHEFNFPQGVPTSKRAFSRALYFLETESGRARFVLGGERLTNADLAKATGTSKTLWKRGKCMVLAAGLVEEHLTVTLSKFDKKDGDIVAQMKTIKPLLDVEIEKEIKKLDSNCVLIRMCKLIFPKYFQTSQMDISSLSN